MSFTSYVAYTRDDGVRDEIGPISPILAALVADAVARVAHVTVIRSERSVSLVKPWFARPRQRMAPDPKNEPIFLRVEAEGIVAKAREASAIENPLERLNVREQILEQLPDFLEVGWGDQSYGWWTCHLDAQSEGGDGVEEVLNSLVSHLLNQHGLVDHLLKHHI